MPGSKAIQAAIKYLAKKGKLRPEDLIKPPKKPRKGAEGGKRGARGDAPRKVDKKGEIVTAASRSSAETKSARSIKDPSLGPPYKRRTGPSEPTRKVSTAAKNRKTAISANYQLDRLTKAKATGEYPKAKATGEYQAFKKAYKAAVESPPMRIKSVVYTRATPKAAEVKAANVSDFSQRLMDEAAAEAVLANAKRRLRAREGRKPRGKGYKPK